MFHFCTHSCAVCLGVLRPMHLECPLPGEKDPHPRALIHQTVYRDETAVFLDDHVDLGKPQACSSRLGRVEGIEDVLDLIAWYPEIAGGPAGVGY